MKHLHAAALTAIGALASAAVWYSHAAAATKTFGVNVNVATAATVALSGTTFTWNAIRPSTQSYVQADNGGMTVSGLIRTSGAGGAGNIVVMSPGNITGQKKINDQLGISNFALTCSGTGNTGVRPTPTYAPALTKLKPSASVPCASWGAGVTSQLHFNFALYLQTQNNPQDVYQSNGFSIIATAT